MRRTWAVPLLRDVLRGRLRMLEPLIDLLAVPLAAAFMLLALSSVLTRGRPAVQDAAVLGLGAVLLYVVVAASMGDDPWANARALIGAPFYIAWKIMLIPTTRAAAKKDATWVRTERNDGHEDEVS